MAYSNAGHAFLDRNASRTDALAVLAEHVPLLQERLQVLGMSVRLPEGEDFKASGGA